MTKLKSTLLVALLVITGLVLFNFSDYLSLAFLQESSDALQSLYQDNPIQTAVIYFVFYVLAVALSIPAASVLTLLAGFLFPFLIGLILVSFASTVGCALAFLIARYLFRDYFQKRFSLSYERIEKGFEKEGVGYLLSLRLIPLFPFFVVNVVMGLTRIPLAKYFIVSQIGMLPATAIFVFAGQQLAEIKSLSDILTPQLWLSLFLLGVTPLALKKIFVMVKNYRKLMSFSKPKNFDYQLIVIGAGAAGLVAANLASKLKAKVMLVEHKAMGGDCLNTGCVPSKALLSAAHSLDIAKKHSFIHAEAYPTGMQDISFQLIKNKISTAISTIEPHDSVERYTALGVDCKQGFARLVSPWLVDIDGKEYSTRSIVLAMGASPYIPQVKGIENVPVYSSETIWSLEQLPKKMLVVGGGAMGCELAQAFCLLGVGVVLLQRNAVLIPGEDLLFSERMQQTLELQGVKIFFEVKEMHFESTENGGKVLFQDNAIEFDCCLFATGRKANIDSMNLKSVGIELDDHRIVVDESLRTSIAHIFAAGDVCSKRQFTHVAGHQGAIAGINAVLRGLWSLNANTQIEALAIFTEPEYARAGFTESYLRAQNIDFELTELDYKDIDRAVTEGASGLIRVLTQKGSDKILGVAVYGHQAGELVQQFLFFMKQNKGLKSILSQQFLYPVWSAALQKVASVWYANQDSKRNDKLLATFHKIRP